MSPSNEKSYSGPSAKRYTTRQIMELTEKRRKLMDEQARQEALAREAAAQAAREAGQETVPEKNQEAAQEMTAEAKQSFQHKNNDVVSTARSFAAQGSGHDVPVISLKEVKEHDLCAINQDGDPQAFHEAIANFTRQVLEHPARFEFPPETNVPTKTDEPSASDDKNEQLQTPSAAVNGKAVAALFREQPRNASEQTVSDLIEKEFDHLLKNVASANGSQQVIVEDVTVDEQMPVAGPQAQRTDDLKTTKKPYAFLPSLMDGLFTASASVLLVLMFVHVVASGWSKYYYDQSSFVVMMTLSALWLNRRYMEKRTQWFLGSTVVIAGGLGVFLASAIEGRAYIELAGFVTVCFGLFLWRYTEESASRLFFPLVCLLFMLAPPDIVEQTAMPVLNDTIYSWSAGILNSFHLPALFDQGNFHVGNGTVSALGDPTAFRSIIASMALAAVCVSFQNMAGIWSVTLFLSVIVWGILGNVVRITVTGVMLENFGVEYASMFFTEYSVVVIMLVMIAGLTLTAGFLPHKEE